MLSCEHGTQNENNRVSANNHPYRNLPGGAAYATTAGAQSLAEVFVRHLVLRVLLFEFLEDTLTCTLKNQPWLIHFHGPEGALGDFSRHVLQRLRESRGPSEISTSKL